VIPPLLLLSPPSATLGGDYQVLICCVFLLGLGADMPGMGMEEVEMEDDGDMEMEMALELGVLAWPDVACPYCYEDHDVASLCVHLEEDHPYEPHPAVSRLAISYRTLAAVNCEPLI
jgi:hypothetical protein